MVEGGRDKKGKRKYKQAEEAKDVHKNPKKRKGVAGVWEEY